MEEKKLKFSGPAKAELKVLCDATVECLELACRAFIDGDVDAAMAIEPLEQIIDDLKEYLRSSHTVRLQQRDCSIELGFVWADVLTDLERISDHCSNIGGCVLEPAENAMELHSSVRAMKKNNPVYREKYAEYSEKYLSALK